MINGYENLLEFISLEDKKNLKLLLDLFLTPEEKKDLGLRYLIVKDLLEGKKTQRAIAEELQVSIAKITRGSNELKRVSPKLLAYLKEKI